MSGKDSISNKTSGKKPPFSGPTDMIVMEIWIWGGNNNYDLIIGIDSVKVQQRYLKNSAYKDSISKMYENHMHLLSTAAVAYIDKYVAENCIPHTGQSPKGEHFFYLVRSNTVNKTSTVCCVENKEAGIAYFLRLIELLEKSPYKEECRYLIGDIRSKFVEGKPFPFTAYQQRVYDSVTRARRSRRH